MAKATETKLTEATEADVQDADQTASTVETAEAVDPYPTPGTSTPILPPAMPVGDTAEDAASRRLASLELYVKAILSGPAGGQIRVSQGEILRVHADTTLLVPEYDPEAENFYLRLV